MDAEIKEKFKNGIAELALSETYVPDVPNDIIFPDELNAYLRDQIQVRNTFLLWFVRLLH